MLSYYSRNLIMKSKTINIPIYDVDLVVKVVKKLDCKAIVYIKGSNVYIELEKQSIDIDTLIHESVHIANRILYLCNVTSDFVNDEPQAYLTEYIFKELNRICL